jgi:hypothetical protein
MKGGKFSDRPMRRCDRDIQRRIPVWRVMTAAENFIVSTTLVLIIFQKLQPLNNVFEYQAMAVLFLSWTF